MKFIYGLVTAALVCATPHAVLAQQDNPTGPYVGVGLGQFNLHVDTLEDVGGALRSVRDSDDNAWKAFAGYRLSPNWSLEAAYIDFGKPHDRFDAAGSNGNYSVRMSGFAPALIGRVPLGPVELFAKAGQYYYNVDTRIDFDNPGPDIRSSHSRNDFLWGGGVSMVLLQRLELRAEYEKIEIENAPDSNAVWLGAAWRF